VRTPLEAVILALRHSRASHLTGSAVLRQVLSASYRDLVQGDRFDLEPVWELLAAQPKFDAAEAMPAFAKVKAWESKLGKTVTLPAAMQELAAAELATLAASVNVPALELANLLRGGKVESDDVPLTPKPATPPRRRLGPTQRRAVMVAAGAVALLAFGFAGINLARGCQTRSWDQLSLEFAADIPLARAARSGPEVAATLRDPGWLVLPEVRRRAQMSAALRALPADVDVFFVRDGAGSVIASARWYGKHPRQIAVALR